MRSAIGTSWSSGPKVSAGRQLVAIDLAIYQVDQAAAQDAFAIFAARVDANGLADLNDAGRFVNVAVQSQQRLVGFDGAPHGTAASAKEYHLARAHNLRRRIGGPIELRAGI